jgi:hypothetical protein
MTDEQPKNETRPIVCLCPECGSPLFSDQWGIDTEQDIKCGVCQWDGKASDARGVNIDEWRDYLFDPKNESDIPPIPRNVFFMTATERIAGLVPDFGLLLAKWGVLSTEALQQPWLSEVFKRAGWAFLSTVAAGVRNPPKIEEKPKEEMQQELPLEAPEEKE